MSGVIAMDAYAKQVAGYLLDQSWQIALLVVVVGLISFALRQRSAHIRYLLWVIVLVKCLVPPAYFVPVAVLPERSFVEPLPLLLPEAPEMPTLLAVPPRASGSTGIEDIPKTPAPRNISISAKEAIVFVWLAGVLLFLWWIGSRVVRYTLWLRRRRMPLPPGLDQAFRDIFMGFKFTKPPKIWLARDINQPFVWGLVRGSVYLPEGFTRMEDPQYPRTLLAHELSHIARFDAAINVLQVAAQAIYWFHPFVWWMNRRIRQEREKCCDEMAVAQLNTLPEHYTRAIVEALAAERRSARRIPSLAIVGSIRDIEERIKTMMKPGKKFFKRPSLIAVIVVLLMALLTVPTALVLTARADTKAAIQRGDDESTQSLHQTTADGDIEQSHSNMAEEPGDRGSESTGLSQSILDKIIENRNKVENFKCINEKFTSFSADVFNTPYLKRDRPSEKAGKRIYRYDTDELALDNKGTGKVTMILEEADSEGLRTGNGLKTITNTWDGENSVRYTETPERSSAIIGGTKPPLEVTKRYAQPWTVFGGEFCNDLKRAIEQNEKIHIEKQKDGSYRIEILRPEDMKIIGVIDPDQGYSMIMREIYVKGKLSVKQKARFEQVEHGIWFPVSGENAHGFTTERRLSSIMTIKDIKINDPNFYDGLYHIDFAEGTYVTDRTTGFSYVTVSMGPSVLLVGKSLPKMKDLNIDLLPANTAGKRILVCFLDIEQRPSRNCLQELNARAQELKTKGIAVVAVQTTKIDKNSLDEWRRKFNISFPFGKVPGDEDETLSSWGVYSLPWLILTDRRHVVAAEGFGLSELDAKIKHINGD